MLRFQLSYNSSMLNVWTRTPLVLAGVAQPHDFPRAIVGTRNGKLVCCSYDCHLLQGLPIARRQVHPISVIYNPLKITA